MFLVMEGFLSSIIIIEFREYSLLKGWLSLEQYSEGQPENQGEVPIDSSLRESNTDAKLHLCGNW